MSLPSPLTASDEWIKTRDVTVEIVRVTAGLHRQVWVSGTSIYVDVHITNNSRKTIKKIELQLERDILCYKHVCSIGISCINNPEMLNMII
jgi:phenolic acid decarboxylase